MSCDVSQVTSAVKCVVSDAEFSKFKLYVVELEKVLKLLLQLSGRLARANNALAGLPQGAPHGEKVRGWRGDGGAGGASPCVGSRGAC